MSERKIIVHFGSFDSYTKSCGLHIDDFELTDSWTHRKKDVTCKECLKALTPQRKQNER